MSKTPIKKKLQENVAYIEKLLDPPRTFDLNQRPFCLATKEARMVWIDGLTNSELLSNVMKVLVLIDREDISVDAVKKLLHKGIIALSVEIIDDLDKGLDQVLAGYQLLLIEGEERAILIEGRSWLSRSPDEPDLEKATRGPGDGFVETLLFNMAIIRRRLRDPKLRAEPFQIGTRAKNDVALIYIDDIVDKKLVEEVRDRITRIEIDGIPLADKTIEEFIIGKTINPLPKVRYTERPDNAAAHLLEGHLIVMVDNSPTALIMPAPLLTHTQSLEEYRQSTLMGSYLTILRLVALLISMLLPPIWLLLSISPELLPSGLEFIGPKQAGAVNLGLQFILASLGIDLIRMASIHTPSALATSLGLIGALMLGDFSVKVGLFSAEVIFYMAIAAIATFTIPGYELALVIKLARFILLVLVVFFKLWGFLAGLAFIAIIFLRTKTFGVPYLWPLIPFKWAALRTLIFRPSVLSIPNKRQISTGSRDSDRKSK